MKTSRMKFAVLTMACASFGISGYSMYLSLPERSGLLVPLNPFRDFGVLPQGASVIAVFELLNDSDAIITIKDIMPNCDCLDAKLTRRTLKPGEIGELSVTWATRNKRYAATSVVMLTYEKNKGHTTRERAPSQQVMVQLAANVSPDFVCDPNGAE